MVQFGLTTYTLLTVAGIITAFEVKVQLFTPQDRVFKDDYKLLSLEEIEKFIKENKHLPGVPSEQESKDGINLGEMNSILLQKIEELTLHIIELKKELDELKKKDNRDSK